MECVQRLKEPRIHIDLIAHERLPCCARDWPEDGTRIAAERPDLQEVNADGTEINRSNWSNAGPLRVQHHYGRSVSRRVASKSTWIADAVGSVCPWYRLRSSLLPYGCSTSLDMRWKEICPIFIPG